MIDLMEEDEKQKTTIPSWADRMMQDTEEKVWRDRAGVTHRVADMGDHHLCHVWILLSRKTQFLWKVWVSEVKATAPLMPDNDDFDVPIEAVNPNITSIELTMQIVDVTWKLICAEIERRGLQSMLERIVEAKRKSASKPGSNPFKRNLEKTLVNVDLPH